MTTKPAYPKPTYPLSAFTRDNQSRLLVVEMGKLTATPSPLPLFSPPAELVVEGDMGATTFQFGNLYNDLAAKVYVYHHASGPLFEWKVLIVVG